MSAPNNRDLAETLLRAERLLREHAVSMAEREKALRLAKDRVMADYFRSQFDQAHEAADELQTAADYLATATRPKLRSLPKT